MMFSVDNDGAALLRNDGTVEPAMPINFRNDVSFGDVNDVNAIARVGYPDKCDVSLWRDSDLCAVPAESPLKQNFTIRCENSYSGMQRASVFEEISHDHRSVIGNSDSTGTNCLSRRKQLACWPVKPTASPLEFAIV